MKMKKLIFLVLGLFIISSIYLFSETNEFFDDFNNLNKDFWLVYDHGGYSQTPNPPAYEKAKIVTDAKGNRVLDLPVNETDHGPELISKGIPITSDTVITFTWRAKVHYSNEYFAGGVRFALSPYQNFYDPNSQNYSLTPFKYLDPETGQAVYKAAAMVYYRNYSYGNYKPPQGGNSFGICGYKKCLTSEPIWDQFFTNKVELNFKEKTVKFWQNEQYIGEVPINPNLDLNTLKYLKVQFSPYGWWTGHDMQIDWFKYKIETTTENNTDTGNNNSNTQGNNCQDKGTADQCIATFDPNTSTLHIPCLNISFFTISLDLKISSVFPEVKLKLDNYKNIPSVSDSKCAATFNNNILHIPCLQYNNQNLWIDMTLLETTPDVILKLTGSGTSNISPNSSETGCLPSDNDTGNTENTENKEVTLSTQQGKPFQIVFPTGKTYTEFNKNYDLSLEPWCTDKPGVCGNFIDLGTIDLNSSIDIPKSGYLSDKAGFEDCVEVEPGHTFINKNRDGSYTLFKIVDHEKPSECDHTLKIEYRNLK